MHPFKVCFLLSQHSNFIFVLSRQLQGTDTRMLVREQILSLLIIAYYRWKVLIIFTLILLVYISFAATFVVEFEIVSYTL